MVLNFLHGGAAINVLARHTGTRVVVVDMGIAGEIKFSTKEGEAPLLHRRNSAWGR